ncbi:MAG: exodeoxyribonuclease VII large subunit [Actinomycetota bacterium]|nr:exodeoxyribonuclease VII large subunit [Actinomycetota bacterium]
MTDQLPLTGAGVEPSPDPAMPGPFAVGRYAAELQQFLRGRTKVLVTGEITGFRRSRVQSFFELRDSQGALPCSIWNSDLEKLMLDEALLVDGAEVVIGGGLDYYPGSATATPSFNFRASHMRLAGEGDLLARLKALREQLRRDGLFEPQKLLARPVLPKTIGVVTARGSAACQDLLAGLERRGWRGTIVWADAPVQDRRAAGRIASALRGLAELEQVEVAVVCRGGGSLADLWAFCDENLCRTVALLRLPVISAVGHEVDRTLIDDVSAVCCSTPTHAAEELVRVNVREARADLGVAGGRLGLAGTGAIRTRGRRLSELAAGPARSVRVERTRLHQKLREVRASAVRGLDTRDDIAARHALVISRKGTAAARSDGALAKLGALESAIRGHDPQRVLERGYAQVESLDGGALTSADAALRAKDVRVRFADDAVRARIEEDEADE